MKTCQSGFEPPRVYNKLLEPPIAKLASSLLTCMWKKKALIKLNFYSNCVLTHDYISKLGREFRVRRKVQWLVYRSVNPRQA